jgi:hypothetical protein
LAARPPARPQVFLWELCTGEPPRRGCLRALEAPADCPEEVAEMGQRCLAADPEDRPTIDEILVVLQSVRRAAKPQQGGGGGSAHQPAESSSPAPGAALPRVSISLDRRSAMPRMSIDGRGAGKHAGAGPGQVLRRVSIMTCQFSSPLLAAQAQGPALVDEATVLRSGFYQPTNYDSAFLPRAARDEPGSVAAATIGEEHA